MQHPMEPVTFDQAAPRERGRAHGELWRAEIAALTAIRTELTVRHGRLADARQALAVASLHLPVLERCTPELYAELLGIAEGASRTPAEIVLLNHYTDLRDVPPSVLGEPGSPPEDTSDPGGCTAVHFGTLQGPVLGQTWDMHASAQPFVRMIRIQPRDSDEEVVCFTLTGCLGMAGMGHTGVGVTINNITCTDGRVGLVWPALVRAMLAQASARAAHDLLMRSPLSSGHHYMIADTRDFFGVECSGELKIVTQKGARAAHLHTNHCFDPVLRQREQVSPASTTFKRMNIATTLFSQRRPTTAEALWELLSDHTGYPESICSHVDDVAGDPSASKTCGRLVMRLGSGELLAGYACGAEGPPHLVAVERFGPKA